MTTDLYRKRPGGGELNASAVGGPGRFGPSRKEEFADVCEGCGQFGNLPLWFSIDFRRFLVYGAGASCFCGAIKCDTAKHDYPPITLPSIDRLSIARTRSVPRVSEFVLTGKPEIGNFGAGHLTAPTSSNTTCCKIKSWLCHLNSSAAHLQGQSIRHLVCWPAAGQAEVKLLRESCLALCTSANYPSQVTFLARYRPRNRPNFCHPAQS